MEEANQLNRGIIWTVKDVIHLALRPHTLTASNKDVSQQQEFVCYYTVLGQAY